MLRGIVFVCMLATVVLIDATAAGADTYPVKPVRFLVAQPAGGNTDLVARSYGQRLSERFGVQFVVDNRGGGGSVIGTEQVVHASSDGYTLLVAPTALGTNPGLMGKLPYETRRDLAPISLLASGPNVLVVGIAFPARSVRDIIAAARSRPGQLNFASSGFASATHIAGELFKFMAKLDMQHVSYRGAPASLVAVSAGESDLSFAGISGALPLVRGGKLRAIAVTGQKRWPTLTEIPTVAESGVPHYEATSWHALLAPAKISNVLIDRLYREVAQIAQLPDMRNRLLADGLEPVGSTPKELSNHVALEIEKWTSLAKAAGLYTKEAPQH